MYQKIQKSPSDNSPTQLKSSQLAQRSTIQTKQNSPKSLSRSENEKEVNRQNRSEVSRLGHNIANIPISSPHKQGSAIQTKLTIGDPGSKNERRADSIAAKVEKQIKSPQFKQQMQAVKHHEQSEESLHAKPNHDNLQSPFLPKVQLKATSEESKADVQPKSIIQRRDATTRQNVSMDYFESELNSAKGKGKPLEPNIRKPIEVVMKRDFRKVETHTDAQADKLTRSIGAKAFTTEDNHVFFRQGEEKNINTVAHEYAHTTEKGKNTIQRAPAGSETFEKAKEKSKQVAEKSKQVGRIVFRELFKPLPTEVYRWDSRSPEVIAQLGFQPWNPDGEIRLDEHVLNRLDSTGEAAKYHSQWVSTGAIGMLKNLDGQLAQKILDTKLYKINRPTAEQTQQTGNFQDAKFKDVNDHFDRIGKDNPSRTQKEWAKEGNIPPTSIEGWMSGQEFFDQYDINNGGFIGGDLTGWHSMPDLDNTGT